jgi:hypothetical protein
MTIEIRTSNTLLKTKFNLSKGHKSLTSQSFIVAPIGVTAELVRGSPYDAQVP